MTKNWPRNEYLGRSAKIGRHTLVKTSLLVHPCPFRLNFASQTTTDGPPDARMHMFKHEGLQWLTNVIPMRKLIFVNAVHLMYQD